MPYKSDSRSIQASRPALIFLLLTVWLLPSRITAQVAAPVSVRGQILSTEYVPIHGALVQLAGRRDTMRTSQTGEFAFPDVAIGAQTLLIRAIGYHPKSQVIQLGPSGWIGTLVLDRLPQALAEVQVTAAGKPAEFANTTKYDDYFRRRQLGFGTFRTRADIEQIGAANIASVLQGIPGVNVSMANNPYGEPEMKFRMARCPGQPPNLSIYINGHRVAVFGKDSENKGSDLSPLFRPKPQGNAESTCKDCVRMGEVLSSVSLTEILFVEFYRGPGQIPNDLDRGDSCAALVIWTR